MILAFLQNQWARKPDRLQIMMDRHLNDLARHCELVKRAMLVGGGITGRRIQSIFLSKLGDKLVLANCTTKVGGVSSSKLAPEPEHMQRLVAHFNPAIILAFGRVAEDAVVPLVQHRWRVTAPHPAARGDDTVTRLEAAARRCLDLENRP